MAMTNDWETRYHDATAMAAVFGKRLAHWRRSTGKDEYLTMMAPGIPLSKLIITAKTVDGHQRTWVHPAVVHELAQWCSVKMQVLTINAIGAPIFENAGEYEQAVNWQDVREEWKDIQRLTEAKSREMGYCQTPQL
jgi:KilA-N domain